MKVKDVQFKNSNGQKLVGILSIPKGDGPFPAVVYAHGFGGRGKDSSKVRLIRDALIDEGFLFLSFDMNGIGDSEGDFFDANLSGYTDDLMCAVKYVRSLEKTGEVSLLGSSIGVSVSVLCYSHNPTIKSMIFVGGDSGFNMHNRNLGNLDEFKRKGYYIRYSKTTGKDMKLGWGWVKDGNSHDFESAFSQIKCPVLVVHADKDSCVPYEHSQRIMQMLNCEKELLTVMGADHWLNDDQVRFVVGHIVEFLKKHS